jgi:FkbM family methyltransferase
MTIKPLDLKQILLDNRFLFDENNKIIFKENIKHIKIDVGLSFDAPHSQNWIDNDTENNVIVIGFEANPLWNEYILSPVKNNNFKDFHTYTVPIKYENLYNKFFLVPVALGNVCEPEFMNFYVPQHSEGCCSLLVPNKDILGDVVKTHTVPVYSLSNFLDFIDFDKIDYIDYIKIDVQGYDINVLKGIGDYIKKIVYVTIEPEVNQYHGAETNSKENIDKYMVNMGFTRITHENTQDPTYLNDNFKDKKDDIYIWQHY